MLKEKVLQVAFVIKNEKCTTGIPEGIKRDEKLLAGI